MILFTDCLHLFIEKTRVPLGNSFLFVFDSKVNSRFLTSLTYLVRGYKEMPSNDEYSFNVI